MPPLAPPDPALTLRPDELEEGLSVARSLRVAVFVVAYNAEAHIEATLRRIPKELLPHLAEIYVIDDRSQDATTAVALQVAEDLPSVRVYRTPTNQGYGGNQKLGYLYAIDRKFDVVVLLHGDGQYAPEVIPRIIAPFADPTTDAVFGSRMMVKGAARRGRMPLYKRIGNRVLTALENRLLGSRLSEFHSGYRAYRVSTLARLPFSRNTDAFHFDTEIIIQLLTAGATIREVPIPTYYGDEICHVYGIPYAWRCLKSVTVSKLNRYHILHDPRFDITRSAEPYRFKTAPSSLHQHILRSVDARGLALIDLGAGQAAVGRGLHEQGARVVAIDQRRPDGDLPFPFLEQDLESGFATKARQAFAGPADAVVALDVIEHMGDPETTLDEIFRALRPGGRLLASTGNVAFLPLRFALLIGQFNYGKRGILDLTHRRLFTIRSFTRLLEQRGFRVRSVKGFGPPIHDMVSDRPLFVALDRLGCWLARLWAGGLAYQFLVDCERREDIRDIMAATLSPPVKTSPRPSVPAQMVADQEAR